MPEFDLHVATEPMQSPVLEQQLLSLGLKHDSLLDRHVDFHGNVAISACPLIGLHMTKKYPGLPAQSAKAALSADLQEVNQLLLNHQAIGYAHGEVTHDGYDTTIAKAIGGQSPLEVSISEWPVCRFQPTRTSEDKKWDLHIAVPISVLTEDLKSVLAESGMYSIDLKKVRNGRPEVFRIYTIQGTSSPADGMKLFQVLKYWLEAHSLAGVEMKQETYIGMIRVGDPLIVPPTVNTVEFRPSADFSLAARAGQVPMVR